MTLPESEKTRVPVESEVPNPAYSSPPSSRIFGTVAIVSTLLISVGAPYKPVIAGYGGFARGEAGLLAGGEERAAAAAQVRGVELGEDRGRLELPRPCELRVAADEPVLVQLGQ